jgi:twitching motility protein PilU
MERDQGIRLMQDLLRRMVERNGSDLFITAGFPPAIKVDGEIRPQTNQPLTPEQAQLLVRAIMNDRQTKEFDATKECNFAIAPPGIGRFRVSAFVQMGLTGAVLRTINVKVPTIEELELPPILKEIVLSKRGLVIVVGATGSGKSTSLAAMLDYRNDKTRGHIITIEDPIEYVHTHRNCVASTRWPVSANWMPYSATATRWSTASSSPRPATWCSPRCTPTAPTRRSTASSTSSRRTVASSC